MQADPCAVETVAVFECVNPLDRPVRIERIKSRCSCTIAQPETRLIPAGGKSSILMVFSHDDRQGWQEKTIEVASDDQEKPERLVLAVDLPVVIRIMPPALLWEPGEAPEWKHAVIELASEACFEMDGVEVRRGDFSAELVVTRDHHEIRVRPRRQGPQSGVVDVRVRSTSGSGQRVFQLFVASEFSMAPASP